MPTDYFTVTDGSVFRYDFSQDFNDAEGITGYALTPPLSHSNIASTNNLEPNTGYLEIIMDNAITGTDSFTFTVEATSTSGTASKSYTMNLLDADTTLPSITNDGITYSGNDGTVLVSANNVIVFTDIDNTD